jgi:hypothetical protein
VAAKLPVGMNALLAQNALVRESLQESVEHVPYMSTTHLIIPIFNRIVSAAESIRNRIKLLLAALMTELK